MYNSQKTPLMIIVVCLLGIAGLGLLLLYQESTKERVKEISLTNGLIYCSNIKDEDLCNVAVLQFVETDIEKARLLLDQYERIHKKPLKLVKPAKKVDSFVPSE